MIFIIKTIFKVFISKNETLNNIYEIIVINIYFGVISTNFKFTLYNNKRRNKRI